MESKKYNKENCSSLVRKVVINKYGDIYTLVGTHAFEWSVISNVNDVITKTTYKNRIEATRVFNILIKDK